ncbi:hypothetical protein HYY75_06990 [bacterium]|nr:hypothetical protein [bacterium]
MRKLAIIISILIVFFPVCSGAFETVIIDEVKYEASFASSAIQPMEYLKIPFGTEDSKVGGFDQDPQTISEGVPYAFLPMNDGSVLLPDTVNQKVKHFSPTGKVLGTLPVGNFHHEKPTVIRDFAVSPQEIGIFSPFACEFKNPKLEFRNGLYLACTSDAKIELIDSLGNLKAEFDEMLDVSNIGVDPKGNLLVSNPVLASLFRFSPDGKLIEKFVNQPNLTTYSDSNGNPYGIRGNDLTAVLYKAINASPVKELEIANFVLDLPPERNAVYVIHKVLGTDILGNVFIQLEACDKESVIHSEKIIIVNPDGKIVSQRDLMEKPYYSTQLPRTLRVMPDGRLMGFSANEKEYIIFVYPL